MNNLTVINHDGIFVVESREVAEMVEKRHSDLLRDIEGYKAILDQNADLRSDTFFIESNYEAGTGKSYKCYLLTRKGCDMVANKMTGEKGVLFTAVYVTQFEKMEKELSEPKQIRPAWDKIAVGEIRFAKEFAKAAGVRPERAVAVALARIEKETGKLLGDYRKTLPAVKEEDAELLTPSQIGEQFGMKASQVNVILEEIGFQYGIREAGSKEGTERLIKRNPWRLTEKGKGYGIMQDAAKQSVSGNWEGFQILWSTKTVDSLRYHLTQGDTEDGPHQ